MSSSSKWTIIRGTIRIEKSLCVDSRFLDTLFENFIQFVNDQVELKCFVDRPNVNELKITMQRPG